MSSPAPGSEPRLFRRRRFAAPHSRRPLFWRLVPPFLAALGLVGVPVLASYWVLTSREFLVRELAVGSAGRVPASWARERLQPLLGRRLLELEIEDVARPLAKHPWLRGVELRKELPGRVEVSLLEKRPAALLARGGELYFLDAGGRIIAPFDPAAGDADLPIVSARRESAAALAAAIALAVAWSRASQAGAAEPSEVETLDWGFRVVSRELPFAVLVLESDLERRLEDLRRLLPALVERFPRLDSVDLRFSDQVVFQPGMIPSFTEG